MVAVVCSINCEDESQSLVCAVWAEPFKSWVAGRRSKALDNYLELMVKMRCGNKHFAHYFVLMLKMKFFKMTYS